MKHTNDRLQTNSSRNKEFYAEWLQTDTGVSRVKEWAAATSLNEDSIFISADVDEVLSREALLRLRWCDTEARTLTGALWTPLGNLNQATKAMHISLGSADGTMSDDLYVLSPSTLTMAEWTAGTLRLDQHNEGLKQAS